ncbi:MAG: hypothetical protein JO147_14270 [Actinobacteria bacterium]|nr:hypothetical protein [Actinomycetota bacterium]
MPVVAASTVPAWTPKLVRRWIIALVCLGAVVVAVLGVRLRDADSRGTPDPGGRTLASLRTAERGVPAGVSAIRPRGREPQWDACDGESGSAGWTPAFYSVAFRSQLAAEDVAGVSTQQLQRAGWVFRDQIDGPTGPTLRFARTLPDGDVASLELTAAAPDQDGSRLWQVTASAPPEAVRSSSC